MNDRIRELLVESGFCFWADEEWGPGPGKVSWDCDYEKEMERFVELLVRECIKCGDNLAKHYINNHSEQEQVHLLACIADYSIAIRNISGVSNEL